MKKIQEILKYFDKYQKHHRVLAFPIAVFKKYGEDEAGNQAALLTYFGFVSLFPLLLILLTVLNVLTRNNTKIEARVVNASLHYFPVASQTISNNIHGLHKTGLSLFIGIVVIFYGSRGVANALQNASNRLWLIPKSRRPDFWHTTLRSIGIIVFGGIGIIASTLILSYTNNVLSKGIFFKIVITLFALLLNAIVFTVVFRLATASEVRTKHLISGAIVAAVFWQILESVGSFLVLHQLRHSSEFYGGFALVLGMLFWIYLQAEVTLLAIEVNVVSLKKLWPRSITDNEKK